MKKIYQGDDAKDIEDILSNCHVNNHFHVLARELDIMEPKHPDDIYKTWLESNTLRRTDHDSARANLAATFVSGFVHAGFGQDKLMENTSECWVYKNKVPSRILIPDRYRKPFRYGISPWSLSRTTKRYCKDGNITRARRLAFEPSFFERKRTFAIAFTIFREEL